MNTPAVPEALMAAQWCSNVPHKVSEPEKEHLPLHKASGWTYDPSTNLYVVNKDEGIFYDRVAGAYLTFNAEKMIYERTAIRDHVDKGGNHLQDLPWSEPRVVSDDAPPKISSQTIKIASDKNAQVQNTPSFAKRARGELCSGNGANGPKVCARDTADESTTNQQAVEQEKDHKELENVGAITFEIKKTRRLGKAKSSLEMAFESGGVGTDVQHSDPNHEQVDEAVERARSQGKIVCVLCRRAFRKASTYERHLTESYLHKTNLEEKHGIEDKEIKSSKRRRVFAGG